MNILDLFDVEITVSIYQNKVWYLAKDVCLAFGLRNTSQSVACHIRPGNAMILDYSCPTGKALFINSQGVFELLTGANSKEVKEHREKLVLLLIEQEP